MHGEEEEDVSNVFAIPDFWKSSAWLKSTTGDDVDGTIFGLDVNSM